MRCVLCLSPALPFGRYCKLHIWGKPCLIYDCRRDAEGGLGGPEVFCRKHRLLRDGAFEGRSIEDFLTGVARQERPCPLSDCTQPRMLHATQCWDHREHGAGCLVEGCNEERSQTTPKLCFPHAKSWQLWLALQPLPANRQKENLQAWLTQLIL